MHDGIGNFRGLAEAARRDRADPIVLALYPSRRHLSAKVRLMVDFLAEAFHGTLPWEAPAGRGA